MAQNLFRKIPLLETLASKRAFTDPTAIAASGGAPPGDPAAAGGMPGDPMAGAAPPAGDPMAAGMMPAGDPMAGGVSPPPPAGGPPPVGPDLMTLLPQLISQAVQQAMAANGASGAAGAGGGAGGGGAGKKPDVGMELQSANRINRKILTLLVLMVKEMGLELPPELALEPEQALPGLPAPVPAPAPQEPSAAGSGAGGGAPPTPSLPPPFPQITPLQPFGQPAAGAKPETTKTSMAAMLGSLRANNDELRYRPK